MMQLNIFIKLRLLTKCFICHNTKGSTFISSDAQWFYLLEDTAEFSGAELGLEKASITGLTFLKNKDTDIFFLSILDPFKYIDFF